ncbi:MAG: EAL domain-containing protein [Paracoccaceae bacterium]
MRPQPEIIDDARQSPLAHAVSQREQDTLFMVRRAIANKRVVLAYQPVMQAARPGHVAFYEALLRVLDDDGRVIPARDFIDTTETHEMGRLLDCLALEAGLDTLAQVPGLRLSINLSARSIGYPRWRQVLAQGLAAAPDIAERLILEISETSAMLMPDLVTSFMADQQARGISFALDEFGAGSTTFRYLKQFYFDIMKIDGQFIRGMAGSPDNQVLVSALISLARHFEMFTVASAVESDADARILIDAGVDCLQGYFFGLPTINPPWLAQTTAKGHRQR